MTTAVMNYAAAFAAGPEQVGGKGWNLARLARYGFSVPAGGVLCADGYVRVLAAEHFRGPLSGFARYTAHDASSTEVTAALKRFAEEVRKETLPADVADGIGLFLTEHHLIDKRLAIRSSAVGEDGTEHSFAGIHESCLNVVGVNEVLQAVLNCYASLWTPQALAYRRRMNVDDRDVACAVVICEMVSGPEGQPVAAGVAFSCDPRSGRRDVLTVNCAAGLGDVVVRGDMTPDEYVLNAHDTTIIESRVERGSPLLDDAQIATLGRLVWRVQWALGDGQEPQDIEWAFDGRQFWLLQSRPVTRLPRWTFPELAGQPSMWSNANVKDSFPAPATIITWSMMEAVVRNVLFASLNLVRYPLPVGMQVMRRFAGRFYFDLAILQWAMYDAIGIMPSETNRTTGGFQPEVRVPAGNPLRGRAGLTRSWRRLQMLWGLARFRRQLPRDIETIFRENRDAREMKLASLSDRELLTEFRRRVNIGNTFTPDIQLAAAYYGAWMTVLQDLLGRLTRDRQQSLVTRLLAASGGVASAEHGYRLIDLAELVRIEPLAQAALDSNDAHAWRTLPANSPFRQAFERYLDEYGHRCVCEMDFASPRWRVDPAYLLEQICGLSEMTPDFDPRERAAQVRLNAETELHRLNWLVRTLASWMLSRTRTGAALRESAKSAAAASVELIQLVLLEVGERMVERELVHMASDVFHLTIPDLEAYLCGDWSGDGAADLVEDRRRCLDNWANESAPDVIVDGQPQTAESLAGKPALGASARDQADNELKAWRGVAAGPGKAAGNACVITAAPLGSQLAPGDVLVAPSTDPAWTPLFLRASALVMETGGYLSHGAIVAREFGIPSVVNIPGIMTEVVTGDRINVDGDLGAVYLLKDSSQFAPTHNTDVPTDVSTE